MVTRGESTHKLYGLRGRTPHVVMIVGPAGAGKSTLAEILKRPEYDISEESMGMEGGLMGASNKSATREDILVIDTPGVPTIDTESSLKHFDAIVEFIKRECVLSTLIFIVHEERMTSHLLRKYRVLLEQFNNLPCSKLIVCRQPELTNRSTRAEEDKRRRGGRLIENALEDTGLSMPLVLLTDGNTEESSQQVSEIVGFVRRSERVTVDILSLRTSDKLRQFLCELADVGTRLDALEQEVQELENSLWNRTLWMTSHVVQLAYVTATSPGAGCLWTGPYVKREQEESRRIRSEIARKREELELGKIDMEELNRVRERLHELDYLSGY